jgi:hypothetical protein
MTEINPPKYPKYTYFTIPFNSVPATVTYDVWFAIWSPAQPGVTWSTVRPAATPDFVAPWVVGATKNSPPPPEATTVIIPESSKCIPPPPLALMPPTTSQAVFEDTLRKQLTKALEGIRSWP